MEPEMQRAEAAVVVAAGDLRAGVDLLVEAADLASDLGLPTQETAALHDLVRLGEAGWVERLAATADGLDGDLAAVCARHGAALAAADGERLGAASDAFAALGLRLLAAEAAAQAAAVLRDAGRRREAARWSTRTDELVAPEEIPGSPTLALRGERVRLTDREREVALLATSGLASNEIARRLAVSRRTVDNHLHRAYVKLGVDGRDALAGALARTAE
jgi:DNA-binding CsgD family transcriptional regulator